MGAGAWHTVPRHPYPDPRRKHDHGENKGVMVIDYSHSSFTKIIADQMT
jgi:hypothetical protein